MYNIFKIVDHRGLGQSAPPRPADPTNQLKRLQPSSKTGRGKDRIEAEAEEAGGSGVYQGKGHRTPTSVYTGVHYHRH